MTKDGSDRVFLRLLRLLRPWWGWIALATVLVVAAVPCELFPAVVWKFVTDDVVLNKHESPLLRQWFTFHGLLGPSRYKLLVSSVGWLFIVYFTGEVLETLESYILNRVAQRFILGFRNQVYGKLQGQSLGYLYRQRTGDLMSRAMGDVDEIQAFIVNSIDVIFSEGLLWIGTVCYVLYANWKVATVSLAPLVVVYLLLRVFNAKVKAIYTAARNRLGDVSTRLQENLNGVVVIKIFGREREEAARFRASTQAYYDQQIRAINARSFFFPLTRVVGFFSNVFMIGVGGYYMLKDGSFTPGDLVMFRAYWWRLFGPIQTLARLNDMVQRANAAGRRVFEVLDAPDELAELTGAAPLAPVRGFVELRDVTFAYPAELPPAGGTGFQPLHGASRVNDRPSADHNQYGVQTRATGTPPAVLHEINLTIQPGQTVALCGPSGSGKSTILNLLLRFYDPTSGAVLLDGHDLRTLQQDSFRRAFALVQQETFLFNDTIGDNIRYGRPEATLEQIIAAAKAANAHGFISAMPQGYETKVGERGVRLSGGQKQRISIARAFLVNPAILLLDEPTSSVEPDSEAAIIAALDRLMAGRTTVLTSHRPSLINQADRVYVIEHGRVAASGAPAELVAGGGWFARFMRSDEASAVSADE